MSTFAFGNGGVPQSRVVYRGSNNANPNCGVSNTNANNDASSSFTNVGSRLANNQSVLRQDGRVLNAAPRGASLGKSTHQGGIVVPTNAIEPCSLG